MGNKRRRKLTTPIKSNSGETLVETIVSVAIFLIALAAMTMLIKSASAINVRAQDHSEAIEAECAQVENSEGVSAGSGSMEILFEDGTVQVIDLDVRSAGRFTYFSPASDEFTDSGGGL